jgi:hypothetical protein
MYPDTVVEAYQMSSTFAGNDPGIDGGTPDTTGLGLPEYDILGQKRVYGDAVDIGAIEFNGAILPLNTIFGTNRKPQLNPEYNRAVIYTLNGRKIDSYSGKVSVHSLRESAGRRLPKGMYIIAPYLPGRQCKMERLLVK